jgi:TetR/AcrR family transcriptional repressor of nem operon
MAKRAARKERTHALIIEEAARSMRLHGTRGVGLSVLMKRVGRTHGGFYAHFASRDELVAAAIERMFEATTKLIDRYLVTGDPARGLFDFIDHYLSDAVRRHPERSCPIPSLSPEASRMTGLARERFSAGIDIVHTAIAKSLRAMGLDDPESLAQSVLFEMAGAMTLARVAVEEGRGAELLRVARDQVKQRLGLDALGQE